VNRIVIAGALVALCGQLWPMTMACTSPRAPTLNAHLGHVNVGFSLGSSI